MPFIFQFMRVVTLISVPLFLIALPISAEAMEKKPKRIDFNDVLPQKNQQMTDTARPVIRIAVAAMISPQYTYRYYIELLNLIGREINREVIFIQKKTYGEVNQMLKGKELDLAFVCSGPYVSGKEDFGMEIIAVPVCHGVTVYYSYFISSKTSGIEAVDDLKGKTFAFTDPLSNTGYLVPTYYLIKRNESPERFFGKTFFTHSHDNSIQAVANGVADGAAVDSLIFEFMLSQKLPDMKNVRVIEKSPPYGIPPIVVHPSMNQRLKNKLKAIFLSIHKTPEGKKILENLMIDRFIKGDDKMYDSVRELQNFLKLKTK